MSHHSAYRPVIAASFYIVGLILLFVAAHAWAGWVSLNVVAPLLALAAVALVGGLHYFNKQGG